MKSSNGTDATIKNDWREHFWWCYGGRRYAGLSLDRPPIIQWASSIEYHEMWAYYQIEPIRLLPTLEGEVGRWFATCKRMVYRPNDQTEISRRNSYHMLKMYNSLYHYGYTDRLPIVHDNAPEIVHLACQYMNDLFALRQQFDFKWDNPDFRIAMVNLRQQYFELGVLPHA